MPSKRQQPPPIRSYSPEDHGGVLSVSTVTLSHTSDSDFGHLSPVTTQGDITTQGDTGISEIPISTGIQKEQRSIPSLPFPVITSFNKDNNTNKNQSHNNKEKNNDNSNNSEFFTLKNAIKMVSLEAVKAEETYKSDKLLLDKANEQLMKFSRLLQEQDAELAATEEAFKKEQKQRESAEKHFIRLKKMMVVKDVEVSEAEQRKKAEQGLRKGAEREMTMLRRQIQAKDTQLAAAERKYQKECKRREKFENQMLELSKQAGKKNAEEQYQILQRIRDDDIVNSYSAAAEEFISSKENSFAAANSARKQQRAHEAAEARAASLMGQLNEVQEQLQQTEAELKTTKDKFDRERELREEADKALIIMREKGFNNQFDRKKSARTHAEDCLNTERLKLRNADLEGQLEATKTEVKKALEKARSRVNEEKSARESLEQQMQENRKSFEAVHEKEKALHEQKIKLYEESLKEAKQEKEQIEESLKKAKAQIEQSKSSTNSTSGELENLQHKYEAYQQQVIDAKAECKKEQTLRVELQTEMRAMANELDAMEEELTAKAKELAEVRKFAAFGDNTNVEMKERINLMEEEMKCTEARCKLFREKYNNEQERREKLEEEVYQMEQKIVQLSGALTAAQSHQKEAEGRCEMLRQKVQSISSSIQLTMAQGTSSEQQHLHLQQKVLTLTQELEVTKDRCGTLQQSLEQAERKCRALEESSAGSESPAARRQREEREQGQINKLKIAEEKWRKEKRQREEAEEQCRSLRQEIIQLKHEQVMEHQNTGSTSNGATTELRERIAKLEEELNVAESRRKVSVELLDNEKKLREEAENQIMAYRDMIPEYAEAEERYKKERKLRNQAESTIDSLRNKLMSGKGFWGSKGNDDGELAKSHKDDHERFVQLQQDLAGMKKQYEKSLGELEKEQNLRREVEKLLKTSAGSSAENERRLRAKAEKQVMSMRLKVEAKETEISTLKLRLSETQSSASENGDSHDRRRHSIGPGEIRSPPPASRPLGYRASRASPQQVRPHQDQRQAILDSLPEYIKNNFGRIGFVRHSVYEFWPALVLDPFTVPASIREKWLELYHEVSNKHKRIDFFNRRPFYFFFSPIFD